MSFVQPPFWGRTVRPHDIRFTSTRIVAPSGEPLTIEELRAQVKLTNDDTSSDAELIRYGIAARQDLELRLGIACITQDWDFVTSDFPFYGASFVVPIRPLQSVLGIAYRDASGVAQTLDPATYDVVAPAGDCPERGRVGLAYGQWTWPWSPTTPVLQGVTLHCRLGYGAAAAVPESLKTVMKLLVGTWFENREAGQIERASADRLPYGLDYLIEPLLLETIA